MATQEKTQECQNCGQPISKNHLGFLEDEITWRQQEISRLQEQIEELEEEKEQEESAIKNGFCDSKCWEDAEPTA